MKHLHKHTVQGNLINIKIHTSVPPLAIFRNYETVDAKSGRISINCKSNALIWRNESKGKCLRINRKMERIVKKLFIEFMRNFGRLI